MEKEEIISLIRNKKLTHLDLLYRDEASGWKPLSRIGEFASYLNYQGSSPGTDPMEWVLLKKVKIKEGVEYKQIGPFVEARVLSMLDSGELGFDDLAWKKSFKSWIPISQLDSFKKPLPSSPSVDPDLYKTGDKDPKKALENSEISLVGGDIDRYFHESEMTPTAPINTEDFVTESRIKPISVEKNRRETEEDSGFSSLEGASRNFKLEDETPLRGVYKNPVYKGRKGQEKNESREKNRISEKSGKTLHQNRSDDHKNLHLDMEAWQWIALALALVLLFVFLYLLF